MGKRNKTDLKKVKPTQTNKNQQKKENVGYKTYEQLNPLHQRAVDLRLNGVKYKDIAQELGLKEQTIREWFIKDGICYFAFNQIKKEREKEKKDLFKEIDQRLKDIAIDAVIVLENTVRKGNWKAAVKALEMAGFEPVHKVADVTEDEKQKTLQMLKEIFQKHGRHRQTDQSVSSQRGAGETDTNAKGNI
jgi:hypothetical protein